VVNGSRRNPNVKKEIIEDIGQELSSFQAKERFTDLNMLYLSIMHDLGVAIGIKFLESGKFEAAIASVKLEIQSDLSDISRLLVPLQRFDRMDS
jgi:hypothetical protein